MTTKAQRDALRAKEVDDELGLWFSVYDAMRGRPEIQDALRRRQERIAHAEDMVRETVERFESRIAELGAERDRVQAEIDRLEAERNELDTAALSEMP